MTPEQLIPTLIGTAPHFLIKAFAVVLLLLHLFFSFVLIRQTKIMIQVLEAQISPALYTLSIIHFLSSLIVFIWVIIFL